MKKKTKKKLSIIDGQCARYAQEILRGTVISIDPSVGSKNSQPGYAVWRAGELEDSGIIPLGDAWSSTVAARLHAFRKSLEDEFDQPDLLILERIVINVKAPGYANASVLKLNQAAGCAMSQWPIPVIEVSPMSWKAVVKGWDGYVKSDEHDAIALGLCVIEKARKFEEEE